MINMLARLAVTRAWTIVAVWVLVVGASIVVTFTLFSELGNRGVKVPGSDSARASSIYRQFILGHDGSELYAVITHLPPNFDAGIGGPRMVRRALAGRPEVADVRYEVFTRGGVIVEIRLRIDAESAEQRVPAIRAALRQARPRSARIWLGGAAAISERYSTIARHDLGVAERLSFPLTFLLLVIAFQSVLAALLPVVLAAATLFVAFAILALIGTHLGLSVFVTNTTSILALGLSIDFSLFFVTRVRQELLRGVDVRAAIGQAMATTGRAIFLSAITIAAALSGLLVVGVSLFSSMALGATLAALLAASASLTLLPAFIFLIHGHIEWQPKGRVARATGGGRSWRLIAGGVTRHPAIAIGASLIVLAVLAVPATTISLGFSIVSALPQNEPVRLASARGSATVELVTKDDPDWMVRTVNKTVGTIWDPRHGRNGWIAMKAIVRDHSDGVVAHRAVRRLRAAVRSRSALTHVGGATADMMDLTARLAQRTRYVILITGLAGFCLLAMGLRSILVPFKAIVGTLLSTVAALGVLARLYAESGGIAHIEFFVPLFLFTILFGLSTDYEIFLLTRIREAVVAGYDTREAVRRGLFESARSITLAGLTLVTVFLAFATSSLRPVQQLGVCLAIAVVIDITLVRCVLIPAAVVVLQRWNWWFPIRRRSHQRTLP